MGANPAKCERGTRGHFMAAYPSQRLNTKSLPSLWMLENIEIKRPGGCVLAFASASARKKIKNHHPAESDSAVDS